MKRLKNAKWVETMEKAAIKDIKKTRTSFKVEGNVAKDLANRNRPKKSGNKINDLIKRGEYILGIENLKDDVVVPLQVGSVRNCLKILIKNGGELNE